jgi:hypothetical protein
MSDTPRFEVIDRRKRMGSEEATPPATEAVQEVAAEEKPAPGPRLVVPEAPEEEAAAPDQPAVPTAEECAQQKAAYEAGAQRLEELIRAQNPGMGAPPPVSFESLVQQFYVSAMIQMGAGTQEGQRPRIDILGARVTIDLLGILAEKTRGNLSEAEERMLQTVLFDVRMAFLELTSMISMQNVAPPPVQPNR